MKILFQGDSITDAGRNYDDKHDLGPGYPKYAAEIISKKHPDIDFEFVNLGISGNKTDDLLERIGVNDCWHFAEQQNFRPLSVFMENYRKILTEARRKTSARIMIVEPFLLPTEDKAFWRCKVDEEIVAVRLLAKEFGCVLCPMDGLLAGEYCSDNLSEFSADGVHPLKKQAEIMGRFCAEYFERLL